MALRTAEILARKVFRYRGLIGFGAYLVLYWVSNTLLYELSKEQLLTIAVSTAAVSASDP